MSKVILAKRYADALGELLETPDELELALAEVQAFADAFESNHDMRTALTNPSIPVNVRAAVLNEILEIKESRSAAKRMIQVLYERDRLTLIPEVAKAFRSTLDRRMNRAVGTLTSVRKISDEKRATIEHSISQFTGKDVHLEPETNSDLLGGVVVRIGGTIIDGSLRTRLSKLKQALLAEENGSNENSSH